MTNRARNRQKRKARQYLKDTARRYILSESGRLYEPEATYPEHQGENNSNGGTQGAPVRVDVLHDWFSVVTSALTVALLLLTVHYTRKQWHESMRSADAATDSAYMACLSAQATQETFAQLERDSLDAHASAAATVKQAEANLTSERANIKVIARLPKQTDIKVDEVPISYIIKNVGKSDAMDMTTFIKAVVVGGDEVLTFDNHDMLKLTANYFGAGEEFPDNPMIQNVIR